KGYIKFGEVAFPVALYTAASSSERISFNTLNRKTGNRFRREFVDSQTGNPVEREDQVKGYIKFGMDAATSSGSRTTYRPSSISKPL
ncbi:Ku protein, partial [Rhizobium ruizarguesonis]